MGRTSPWPHRTGTVCPSCRFQSSQAACMGSVMWRMCCPPFGCLLEHGQASSRGWGFAPLSDHGWTGKSTPHPTCPQKPCCMGQQAIHVWLLNKLHFLAQAWRCRMTPGGLLQPAAMQASGGVCGPPRPSRPTLPASRSTSSRHAPLAGCHLSVQSMTWQQPGLLPQGLLPQPTLQGLPNG